MSTAERFFLCCGLPKAGTTFLQRTLNLHPEISCPSEQYFPVIVKHLNEFAAHYQSTLAAMDRRTGGQGAPVIDKQTRSQLFKSTVVTLSRAFAVDKPIHGLNENNVFTNLATIHETLGHPLVIAIVRNPIDLALSEWRHNRLLAQQEPKNAHRYLEILNNPDGTLDGYVRKSGQFYPQRMQPFLDYARGRRDILTVRYEDMAADTAGDLRRMLRFLGADASEPVIADIVRRSSKEEMAKVLSDPAFFGSNEPREQASPTIRAEVMSANEEILEALGYKLPGVNRVGLCGQISGP